MTTVVKSTLFGSVASDTEAQLIANNMAVTPEYFAEVSCEGDRLFGLVTTCRRETCEETCETVLNGCARKNIWQYSYMVQQELEALLHWTLTPRYVTETIPWDGKSRLQLTFTGVDKVMVQESVSVVDTDVTYHPYVTQVVTQVVIGQSYTEVLIPFEYISQAEKVLFRNPNTGKVFDVEEITSYPQIRTVGPDKFWVLAIPGGNADPGDSLDILDCLWGYIDAPDVECDDSVAVVYSGTVQKIPIEKITDDRWFIKHRNMVRLEYQGDTIDLTKLQVHKLYDVVDIGCFGEECVLATIHKKCVDTAYSDCDCDDTVTPCSDIEVDGCIKLINSKAGIIEITEVEVITDELGDPILGENGCPTFRQKEDCTFIESSMPYKVTVSYYTNPATSGIAKTSAVETLRRAIAARVAAEVTLVDCGCNIECGFFKTMRAVIGTTAFTPSGATIVARKFGDMEGQQVYARALESAQRDQPFGMA